MRAKTDAERFILDEVSPALEAGETVECAAYLVEQGRYGGAVPPTTAWFFALTDRRLFRIKTRVGAVHVVRENREMQATPYDAVEAVFIGTPNIVLRFRDGPELQLVFDAGTKTIGAQAEFLARLQQLFGSSEGSRRLIDEMTGFGRRLRETTPRLVATPAFIVACAVVFIAMLLDGVSPLAPGPGSLLAWGANFGPSTLGDEPWRLFSCMFVHIGVLHLGLNMWALYSLGELVERMLGHFTFAVVYLVTGGLASTASVLFNPMIMSAGASGAIFGLGGTLLGIVLINRQAIPARALAQLRGGVGAFLFYNLIFGLMVPNIDHAAHIGGLLAGVPCGLVVARSMEGAPSRRWRYGLVLAVAGVLALVSVGQVWPKKLAAAVEVLDRFSEVEAQAMKRLSALSATEADDDEIANALDNEILPAWTASRKRLLALEGLPARLQQRVDLVAQYAIVREDQWRLMLRSVREADPVLMEEAMRKRAEADRLAQELSSGGGSG